MQCAKGAPGPGDGTVGAGKAGGVRPHCVSHHSLQTATPQGLSSETHLPNSPSPTPEVGSEAEGYGISLLLLGYL